MLALRLAIPNLDLADLNTQLALLTHIRTVLDQDQNLVSLFLPCDFRCHMVLVRATGDGRLLDYLSTLRSQFNIFQIKDTRSPQRICSALDDHERILLALLEQNDEQAAILLSEHLARSKTYVLADFFVPQSTE